MKQEKSLLSSLKRSWLVLLLAAPLHGQTPGEVKVVVPGDSSLDPSVFQPFEAEYEQGGYGFRVEFRKIEASRPYFSMLMISVADHLGVDHVGHFTDDLSLAFRRFNFGRFGAEYINLESQAKVLKLSRMPLAEGKEKVMSYREFPLRQAVVDGTSQYWFLAGLPLAPGTSWSMHTWWPTADGLEEIDSPPFVVEGETSIQAAGQSFSCWIVTAMQGDGKVGFRSYVSKSAPYLIRQEMIQEGKGVDTVLDLKSVKTP